ncbi:MAG: shikimate kinase [Candidatus Izemoplasmatales bacterium]
MNFALIGSNISQSYSKTIHENLLISDYQLLQINNVKDVFDYNLKGFNVTHPFKEEIIPYLSSMDDIAKETRVVNTVLKKNDQYIGFNTDYEGFKEMMAYNHVDFNQKNVLILGNGASSRTIEYYLMKQKVKSIVKLVRTIKNDHEDLIKNQSKYMDTHIIINTTTVGMSPHTNDKLLLNFHHFPECNLVIDIIYNPHRSKLLIEAEKFNKKTINGLYMLLIQAKKAQEIWFNQTIDSNKINLIYHNLLNQYVNIVLIGMPFSGKTTFGQLLSRELHKKWIDTDIKIEEYSRLKINQIFKLSGEEKFREIESQVIDLIRKNQGIIISTGGGVVLNYKNMEMLKENGLIIYINNQSPNLNNIDFSHRPLINDLDDINKMKEKRDPIYKKVSDIEMTINESNPFSVERLKDIVYEYFNR